MKTTLRTFPLERWMLLSAVLLCLVGLLPARQPALAAEGVSWEEYWRLAEDTQNTCDEMEEAPAIVAGPEFRRLATRWKAVQRVTLPNRATVSVDPSTLVALLEANPPDVGRIRGFVKALLAEQEAYSSRPYDPADFRTLERILAEEKYQWPQQGSSPLDDFWKSLNDALNRLLNRLFGNIFGGAAGELFNIVFVVIGTIVLLIILFFILRSVSLNLVAESRTNAEEDDKNLTADTALKRAQALSNQGDYRSAVRYLYLSSLLLLEEHGLLRYDRSKTNREYLRAVSDQPSLSGRLQGVVDIFDRVWYGFQKIDQETFEQYSEQVEDLRKQRPNP